MNARVGAAIAASRLSAHAIALMGRDEGADGPIIAAGHADRCPPRAGFTPVNRRTDARQGVAVYPYFIFLGDVLCISKPLLGDLGNVCLKLHSGIKSIKRRCSPSGVRSDWYCTP